VFKNPKKAANMSSKMASPTTLFGVEEDAADSRSVIESGAFLNESCRNAIVISARIPEQKTIEFNQIAFRVVSTDNIRVGQQHRTQAKRKRRRAYLERKKAALRASAAQPASGKQRAKKESAPEE
jgi:hypothetical protein